MSTLNVALIQMNSQDNRQQNVEDALELIKQAAQSGARLVALPEVWTYMGADSGIAGASDTIPGALTDQLAEAARTHGIYVHAGSILEQIPGSDKVYNTSTVFDPAGNLIATYRKIHLFDVDVDGGYRESKTVEPGSEIVTFDLDGVRVGLAICYDLRFPELFRILALEGAEIIILPAAFTRTTGQDHWETLIQARAIENGVWMLAPGQWGQNPTGNWCYGRSMIVDPWGNVVRKASDVTAPVHCEIDLDLVRQVRNRVPSLQNRQPDSYRWPDTVLV